jgi:pimeloyl-ACP methyl ester carboxylesterase
MSVRVDSVLVAAGDGHRLQVLTTTGTDTPTVVLHMGTPAGWRSFGRSLFTTHDAASSPTPDRLRRVDAATQSRGGRSGLDALGIDHFVTGGWSGGSPCARVRRLAALSVPRAGEHRRVCAGCRQHPGLD